MRAIGIVRVSQTKGREGPSFASPAEQLERIQAACERDNMRLIATEDEFDVSGGSPLADRPGLLNAVEAVEAGGAEVVIVAYFDRLVRSLPVQHEVVTRVEQAGGRVMTVDFGQVTGSTAAQWLSGTMIGAVSEYFRRSAKERSAEAQAAAVARGVVPYPSIPPGYVRGQDGILTPDHDAPAIAKAFQLRAEGKTIAEVREFLTHRGIPRSYRGVQSVLSSRLYLGEIHFGQLVNPEAHEPIVDRDLWKTVQRVKVPRGRRAKSERLLARLGVLRCGTCGARMVVGTQTTAKRVYPFYRCAPTLDCPRRMTISAQLAEDVVVAATRKELANHEGRASAEADAQGAVIAAEKAQADLDAALRAFAGLEDEVAARERLAELRSIRDDAVERAEHLRGLRSALTISVGEDWKRLTLEEKRGLIRATIASASVGPGRGRERIRITLFSEQAASGAV